MNEIKFPAAASDGGLDMLVKHISAHNSDVMRHSMRVATYAVNIGRKMGVAANECRSLLHGCLVHDIGYLWVPKAILRSPRKLALHEKVKVHRHVDFGHSFVSRYVDDRDVIDIVKYHHERVDGKGYPHRIGGASIPLLPRIAAVADAFEAMTGARAYRPAYRPEAALGRIGELADKQFDASVVSALHECVASERTAAAADTVSYNFDDVP